MINNKLSDFTRGGQTTMHAIRMFNQSIKYIFTVSFMLCCILFVGNFISKTSSYHRYIGIKFVEAKLYLAIAKQDKKIKLKNTNQQTITIRADDFLSHRMSQAIVGSLNVALKQSFAICIYSLLFIIVLVIWIFVYRGKKQRKNKNLKGARFATCEQLIKEIKNKVIYKDIKRKGKTTKIKSKNQCDLNLAGVPIPRDFETQYFLITGTVGSGKTQAIMGMLDQIRKLGKKAIIVDLDGCYLSKYYNPDKDIYLNPLDERCPAWDIWAEADDSADYESFAEALIPMTMANNDPFWVHAARTIFSIAAFKLKDKVPTTKKLLSILLTQSLGKIQELVANTVAESLVAEKIEKTALSIKATLATYCKSLLYLPETKSNKPFSIHKWITDDSIQDSWLFIGADELKIAALRPLITAWFDMAVRAMLSLNEDLSRRIWFVCDELATLQRLPNLSDGAARGRKRGLCLVAGIQDVNQLRVHYGNFGAEALLSHFNIKLCLRVNSPETARWVEKAMGEQEIMMVREGKSYGAHEMRDGVSINEDIRTEPIVMSAEILKLDNLSGYICLPGDYPIAKVRIPIMANDLHHLPIIPRQTQDILLMQEEIVGEKSVEESFLDGFRVIQVKEDDNSLFTACVMAHNIYNQLPIEHDLTKQISSLRQLSADFLECGSYLKLLEQFIAEKRLNITIKQYLQQLRAALPGDEFIATILAKIIPAKIYINSKHVSDDNDMLVIHLQRIEQHFNLLLPKKEEDTELNALHKPGITSTKEELYKITQADLFEPSL